MQSPNSQCSSKKIVNGGLCVVAGFVQGGVVVCSIKECVVNYINGDLDKHVCQLNWCIFKLTGNCELPNFQFFIVAQFVCDSCHRCNVRLKT